MTSSAAVFISPMPSTMIGCDLGRCGVTILSDDRTISDVDALLSLFYCLLSLSFAYVWLLFTPSKFCLILRRAKASKHFSCRLRTGAERDQRPKIGIAVATGSLSPLFCFIERFSLFLCLTLVQLFRMTSAVTATLIDADAATKSRKQVRLAPRKGGEEARRNREQSTRSQTKDRTVALTLTSDVGRRGEGSREQREKGSEACPGGCRATRTENANLLWFDNIWQLAVIV